MLKIKSYFENVFKVTISSNVFFLLPSTDVSLRMLYNSGIWRAGWSCRQNSFPEAHFTGNGVEAQKVEWFAVAPGVAKVGTETLDCGAPAYLYEVLQPLRPMPSAIIPIHLHTQLSA